MTDHQEHPRATITPAERVSVTAFLRRGAPIPLTATDYSVRTGLPMDEAQSALRSAVRIGVVTAKYKSFARNQTTAIYDLTPHGLELAIKREKARRGAE